MPRARALLLLAGILCGTGGSAGDYPQQRRVLSPSLSHHATPGGADGTQMLGQQASGKLVSPYVRAPAVARASNRTRPQTPSMHHHHPPQLLQQQKRSGLLSRSEFPAADAGSAGLAPGPVASPALSASWAEGGTRRPCWLTAISRDGIGHQVMKGAATACTVPRQRQSTRR
jgi:hypothetical protein